MADTIQKSHESITINVTAKTQLHIISTGTGVIVRSIWGENYGEIHITYDEAEALGLWLSDEMYEPRAGDQG